MRCLSVCVTLRVVLPGDDWLFQKLAYWVCVVCVLKEKQGTKFYLHQGSLQCFNGLVVLAEILEIERQAFGANHILVIIMYQE